MAVPWIHWGLVQKEKGVSVFHPFTHTEYLIACRMAMKNIQHSIIYREKNDNLGLLFLGEWVGKLVEPK